VYYCCGAFAIDGAGGLARISDAEIAADVAPLKSAGLTLHYVMGIADEAVLSQTWKGTDAIAMLAAVAQTHNFDGYICDYEPSSDYTLRHAQLYSEFLGALSGAMHKVHREAGFCSAGWGILDQWSTYRTANVDIATSMTPTYNWLGNGDPLYRFVQGETASGAMPVATVGAGVGTTMVAGYKPEWQYNWTAPTMKQFATWLRDTANISRMDLWRADIDHNWHPAATAPFVFEAAAAFLN
jgi:hypothetical protein